MSLDLPRHAPLRPRPVHSEERPASSLRPQLVLGRLVEHVTRHVRVGPRKSNISIPTHGTTYFGPSLGTVRSAGRARPRGDTREGHQQEPADYPARHHRGDPHARLLRRPSPPAMTRAGGGVSAHPALRIASGRVLGPRWPCTERARHLRFPSFCLRAAKFPVRFARRGLGRGARQGVGWPMPGQSRLGDSQGPRSVGRV